MEIDITHLEHEETTQWSDSIANSGLQNIGQVTWRNAVETATERPLVTPEQQAELRYWLLDFGAWDEAEIAAMGDDETNAMLLQFIAGDLKEYLEHEGTEDFELWVSEGWAGRVSRSEDGRLFFST